MYKFLECVQLQNECGTTGASAILGAGVDGFSALPCKTLYRYVLQQSAPLVKLRKTALLVTARSCLVSHFCDSTVG